MRVRVAIDTHVLASAEGAGDEAQRARAVEILATLPDGAVVLPVQVLGELYRVLVGKLRQQPVAARANVLRWSDAFAPSDSTWAAMQSAFDLSADHGLSIRDALILSVAAEQRCRLLLSEDLQDGFTWRGTTVVDPFAREPSSQLHDLIAPGSEPARRHRSPTKVTPATAARRTRR
jgi:predicted nucleic acid-binding protein